MIYYFQAILMIRLDVLRKDKKKKNEVRVEKFNTCSQGALKAGTAKTVLAIQASVEN